MSAYAASVPVQYESQPLAHVRLGVRAPGAERSPRGSDRSQADMALGDLLNAIVERVADAVVARLDHQSSENHFEWLDTREAAEFLGMHRDTLRRLAAERAIPSEQDGPGCKLHFRRSELDEWRRSGGRARHLSAIA